jgi:hypothetical protein
MRRYIPIVVVLFTAALAQVGCLSPIAEKPPKIVVARSGQVTVNGQPVQVPQLGKKLKSMGVPTTAAILVSVYKDMPKAMERNIGRPLMSAGYSKLMFVEPKEILVITSTTAPSVSYSSTTQTVTKASSGSKTKSTSTKKTSSTTGL